MDQNLQNQQQLALPIVLNNIPSNKLNLIKVYIDFGSSSQSAINSQQTPNLLHPSHTELIIPSQQQNQVINDEAAADLSSLDQENELQELDQNFEDLLLQEDTFDPQNNASLKKPKLNDYESHSKNERTNSLYRRNIGSYTAQVQKQSAQKKPKQDYEDLHDIGPYDSDILNRSEDYQEEEEDDDVQFDQGINEHKQEDQLYKGLAKAQAKQWKQAVWKRIDAEFATQLPKVEHNKQGGPRLPLSKSDISDIEKLKKFKYELKPFQAFSYFFPEELYQLILEQMLIYANQQVEKQLIKPKYEWRTLSLLDIKNFIGISLWLGIHRLPHLESHWSKDPLYQTSFGQCIGRQRWEVMNQAFHLADNSKANKKDPLYKIRPFINVLEQKFVEMYDIGENVTIDEAMVKWKGTLYFKQLIKNKPIKYGIKLFLLCDAKLGYCHSFKVYTGKRDDMISFREELPVQGRQNNGLVKSKNAEYEGIKQEENENHINLDQKDQEKRSTFSDLMQDDKLNTDQSCEKAKEEKQKEISEEKKQGQQISMLQEQKKNITLNENIGYLRNMSEQDVKIEGIEDQEQQLQGFQ